MNAGGGITIIIYGCGGHARSIINVLYETESGEKILLVDDNAAPDEEILGCQTVRNYALKADDHYIIALGDNRKRSLLYDSLTVTQPGHCTSVISAAARIGVLAVIGNGTFVAPNAYIGPQAIIGNDTIINTGSIVEHEVQIGNHSHIAPHTTICGRAQIGNHVFCGAGSVIIDGIHVCDDVVIGAGAVVKEDIIYPGTYVGVPARYITA